MGLSCGPSSDHLVLRACFIRVCQITLFVAHMKFSHLLCADDAVLFDKSGEELSRMVVWFNACRRKMLKGNGSKSKRGIEGQIVRSVCGMKSWKL